MKYLACYFGVVTYQPKLTCRVFIELCGVMIISLYLNLVEYFVSSHLIIFFFFQSVTCKLLK